jgi:hypothetical protein
MPVPTDEMRLAKAKPPTFRLGGFSDVAIQEIM